MATLGDAEAAPLLTQLEKLISVADAAFCPGSPFVYPSELGQLPNVVRELQRFLGRRRTVRVPFWNYVKAIDERRQKLGLVATLEAMVGRATSMSPGPLFRLLTERDKGGLNEEEKGLLLALDQHLRDRSDHPPQNLSAYRPLFAQVPSTEYERLEREMRQRVLATLVCGAFKDMLDYAAYLDFCQQHYRWIERYLDPLADLYGLLLSLEHEPFFRQLNLVLYGSTPVEAKVKAINAKSKTAWRQWRRRVKLGKAPALPEPGSRKKTK